MTVTFTHLIQARILEVLSVDGAENQENRYHHVFRQYTSEDGREQILQELDHAFALLSPAQQQVFDRFIKDAAFSTHIVAALAYYASSFNPAEVDPVTALGNTYPSDFVEQIAVLLSIDNAFRLIRDHANLQKALSMYAFLTGKSGSTPDRASQLIRFGHITLELLNNMCSEARMDALVQELTKDMDPHAEANSPCSTLLVKILLRFKALSDMSLQHLTETLLLHVSARDIIALTKKEPNTDRVKACLHRLFTRSLAAGKPKYYYALAVLSFAFDPQGFDTAAEWAASKNAEKALLGISMLGLAAWSRNNKNIILQGQPLRLTTETLKNIQRWLSKDSSAYTIVADNVFDLYAYALFDPRNLQYAGIIETAINLLRSSADEDRRAAAEKVLCMVPINTRFEHSVLHTYGQVFDALIRKEPFDLQRTAIVFKMLTKLRRAEGEAPSMARLKQLYAKAAATEDALESDLKFLELAREELFSFSFRNGTNYETYYPAFSVLMYDISSQDMEDLMMLVRRMHRDNVTFQAGAFEASKIVRFLRSGVNPQSLSILLENTEFRFDPHEASSYLITWLFYLFVHYRKPQAVAFYEKYADILNRPCRLTFSYPPYRELSATIQEYSSYLNKTLSRVEAIFFELLSEENNRTVAELFANEATAPSNLPVETRERICQLLDDSSQILEAYHLTGLSPFDDQHNEITVPLRKDPERPLDLAMLYPDDLIVVEYATEREKAWVGPLVNYAYRIDRVLAQRLIREQRSQHYHLFLPEVRFDRETFELYQKKQRKEEEMLKRYGGTI